MDFEIENTYFESGIEYLAGVDEAGRGPLAGPVFAAAVVLKKGEFIEGVTDSKKLSEKKRDYLYEVIKERALAFSVMSADEKVIDDINIRNATFRAMNGAVDGLAVRPEFVLIDGNAINGMEIPHNCIVKGDFHCNCIGAASILAKVERDRLMMEYHEQYPQYRFDLHKGYPTKLHYEMLEKYGPSPIHRITFLKKFFERG